MDVQRQALELQRMTGFALDPRLEADTFPITDWKLSRVLAMNDARYRWLVLVPRKPGLVELFDLNEVEQITLMQEIVAASAWLKRDAAKINVGTLGNIVAQLHVHVVARKPGDPAWPGPVWGHSTSIGYDAAARARLIAEFVNAH